MIRRPTTLIALAATALIVSPIGSVALAGVGSDAVKARGTLQGSPVVVDAKRLPKGELRGTIENFLGVTDVTCMDFRVAEGIPFVPDGSQMARVGGVVRNPVDFVEQIAYIFIKTPTGQNFVWGAFGVGGLSANPCDVAGFSDSVPPEPFIGKLKLRDH
jgi:hypothetical protein